MRSLEGQQGADSLTSEQKKIIYLHFSSGSIWTLTCLNQFELGNETNGRLLPRPGSSRAGRVGASGLTAWFPGDEQRILKQPDVPLSLRQQQQRRHGHN